MFIDIHVHIRKYQTYLRNKKATYSTPEHIIKRYDQLKIKKAVILPGGSTPECKKQSQSEYELLEICEMFPGRFIPFCNVDPRELTNSADAPLDELLIHFKELGFKGIGEVSANLPFLNPMVQNLFKHTEAVGFPLTFHVASQIGGAYGLYDDPGLPQLERSLQKFPGLKFLAHSQAFWAEMAPLQTPADRYGYPKYPVGEEGVVPKLFRRYENLLGDLSAGSGCNALARDEEYAVKFLEEFQDRLFFGTDICAPDTPAPLVDLLNKLRSEARISNEVFNKVAWKNAAKLFSLDEKTLS